MACISFHFISFLFFYFCRGCCDCWCCCCCRSWALLLVVHSIFKAASVGCIIPCTAARFAMDHRESFHLTYNHHRFPPIQSQLQSQSLLLQSSKLSCDGMQDKHTITPIYNLIPTGTAFAMHNQVQQRSPERETDKVEDPSRPWLNIIYWASQRGRRHRVFGGDIRCPSSSAPRQQRAYASHMHIWMKYVDTTSQSSVRGAVTIIISSLSSH